MSKLATKPGQTPRSSPPIDFNKRPSYLEITNTRPGNTNQFDEGVIRRLEPQFNDLDIEKEQMIDEEEEEEFEQIKTYLRIRPYVKTTKDEFELLEIKDENTVIANCVGPAAIGGGGKRIKKMEFKFTKVLGATSSQEHVFEQSIAPLLDRFDSGENCLIFSYGATNSGKTYTMKGSSTKYGIIPRTLYHIFNRYQARIYKRGDVQPFRHESTRVVLHEQRKILFEKKKTLLLVANDTTDMKNRVKGSGSLQRASDASSHCVTMKYIGAPPDFNRSIDANTSIFGMWVSFVELYNEKCFDLLSCMKRNEVKIVSEKGGYSYFKDLTELPVSSEDEAFALYVAGCKKLEVSATLANHTSSRSHSFFTIRVVELGKTINSVYPIKVHRMTFCDLAGCERVAQTENTGGQLRESANINQSLLSLLKVIRMIRDKQSHNQTFLEKIPFRDSKLTRIFQGYLTTSTHIAMIVNVNPIPKMVDSSMQTLINSAIASNIIAFRPKQSSTHLAKEHSEFNSTFLHSSLDLEDVMEQPEEEEAATDKQPPLSFVVPQQQKQQPKVTKKDMLENVFVASPVQRRILQEQNRVSSPNVKFNDFKKPKLVEQKENNNNKRNEEYQKRLLNEIQELRDTIADLNRDVMLRDIALDKLNGRIRTVECETREQMIKEFEKFKYLDDPEQLMKSLNWSEQRQKYHRSRIALQKKMTSSQTDIIISVCSVETQTNDEYDDGSN